MKNDATFVLIMLLVAFSCNSNQEKNFSSFSPEVVKANGYLVPKESMAAPNMDL